MSAATRRPYLGETVHVQGESAQRGRQCRPAFVTAMKDDSIELWVLARPQPRYVDDAPHDEAERIKGSWHFASH
jgi:hypothetical protein